MMENWDKHPKLLTHSLHVGSESINYVISQIIYKQKEEEEIVTRVIMEREDSEKIGQEWVETGECTVVRSHVKLLLLLTC
jgi:hypothetical protein